MKNEDHLALQQAIERVYEGKDITQCHVCKGIKDKDVYCVECNDLGYYEIARYSCRYDERDRINEDPFPEREMEAQREHEANRF